ncbi:MAG: hypothetical protein ABI333_22850 [bacterium]
MDLEEIIVIGVILVFVIAIPGFNFLKALVSVGADKKRGKFAPALVKHLLNKGFMIGGNSSQLWAFDVDEELNEQLDSFTDDDLARIYDEHGLVGQLGRRKVLLRTDSWGDDEHKILEVFLYWRRNETGHKIELDLETEAASYEPDLKKRPFDTQNDHFNKFFKKRWGNKFIHKRLSAAGPTLDFTKEFVDRWGSYIKKVSASDSLEVKFDDRALTKAGDPVAALEQFVADIDRLAAAIETSVDPSFVVEEKEQTSLQGPRYAALKIMTQCPECKSALPLNGPVLNAHCDGCQSDLTLKADFWDSLLGTPYTDYHQGGGGMTINFTTEIQWQAARPKCHECKEELPVDDIPVGTDGNVFCAACGKPNATYPAPAWARKLVPKLEQLYRADRDTTTAAPGQHAAALATGAAPIVLNCPQCGGALQANEQSERTILCGYCSVQVFLPDEIWMRLHPKKTAGVWYARYEARKSLA